MTHHYIYDVINDIITFSQHRPEAIAVT